MSLIVVSCVEKPKPPKPEPKDELTIEISDISDVSFNYAVKPNNDSVRFMFAFSPADFYDEVGGDDGVVDAYMENLEYTAQMLQKPVKEVFAEMTYDSEETGVVDDADPETEYVFFAFGVDEEYQQCTKLFKKQFSTLPLQSQDIKFTIDVSNVTETTIDVAITPDNEEALYFYSWISEEELNEYFPGPDGYAASVLNLRDYYLSRGYSPSDLVEGLGSKGSVKETVEDLLPGVKYHVFAIGINSGFLPNSEATSVEVTTVEVQRSNIEFTIDTTSVTAVSVKGNITASNKDNYIWAIFETGIFDSYDSEEELMMEYVNYLKQSGALEESMCSGDKEFDVSGLRPNAKYSVVAFAYNHIPVSDLARFDFTTKELSGDPCDMTFSFEFFKDENGADAVRVTPSMMHYYWYDVMAKADYEAMAAEGNAADLLGEALYENLKFLADMMGTTPEALIQGGALVGEDIGSLSGITPGVELVVYAFAVDLTTAKNACDTAFISEPFVLSGPSAGVTSLNRLAADGVDAAQLKVQSVMLQFGEHAKDVENKPILNMRKFEK